MLEYMMIRPIQIDFIKIKIKKKKKKAIEVMIYGKG